MSNNGILFQLLQNIDLNLKRFDDILTNSKIYDDFPGLPVFVKEVVTSEGAILSDRVTFNVKKMVASRCRRKVHDQLPGQS